MPEQGITAEERREAWKAFFRRPWHCFEVFAIFPVAVYVIGWWEFDFNSIVEVNAWVSTLFTLFYFFVIGITHRFGSFHGLFPKKSWPKPNFDGVNPYKLIKCSQNPLFPAAWKYVVYGAHIGMFIIIGYWFLVILYSRFIAS